MISQIIKPIMKPKNQDRLRSNNITKEQDSSSIIMLISFKVSLFSDVPNMTRIKMNSQSYSLKINMGESTYTPTPNFILISS